MKKIFLSGLLFALLAAPAFAAADGGGKKKAKKKAKTECRKDSSCDPKNCDPKNCDYTCSPSPACKRS